jgi:hypothetical protein
MLSSYREIRVIEVRIIELKLRIKYCLSAIANKFVRVIETFELPKVRVMEVRLYYIPSAKFFIGNFFANERKHP